MGNERFAVEQKLEDIYRGQLTVILDQYREHWRRKVNSAARLGQPYKGAGLFAAIVSRDVADSAIVYAS